MSDGKSKANSGSWKPGESGNPNGPPRGILRLIRERFGKDAPTIMGILRDLATGKNPEGFGGAEIKTSDRVKAGTEFLDRLGVTAIRQINVSNEPAPAVVDMTKLTDAQLEALAAIEFVEATDGSGDDDLAH